MSNGIETPRPLTPQEFFRLEGQQSFIDYINETNNQLGMLQELQRVAGDGDLLDEDTGETPRGSLDPSLTEESVWDMLTSIMAGRQGTIQGLDPEIIEALETSVEGLNDDELRAVAEQIVAAGGYDNWVAQQEGEITDINEDTVDNDTTVDIPDYSDLVNEGSAPVTTIPGVGSVGTGTPSTSPSTPMTPPPGSAGVIIDIEDLMNAGDWTVFVPGVIPGLPSSPTILGTIEDILESPSQVLGDLWDSIENTVANPQQVLNDILNDAADSEGLITIGGIQTVISDLLDQIGDEDVREELVGSLIGG
jgi:hypothetical protein